jgi:hypothetical protein
MITGSSLNNPRESSTVLGQSKVVAHLLAGSMTRTSSEANVEGMGSVSKMHTERRGILNSETLDKELFLNFNGLTPTT